MTPVWLIILVVALAIAGMMVHLRRLGPAAPLDVMRKASPPSALRAATRAPPRPPASKPKQVPPVPPELEWDAPVMDVTRKYGDGHGPRNTAPIPNDLHNAQRAKIRGRYLAARFPGVARTAADLVETQRIIQSARLYFEERKSDRAIELLDLAVAQCPADESLPLARLEIAFLTRDAALYVALAATFRRAHPSSTQWDEVARLGRAIAPEEAAFGTPGGPRATDHYGPWPDMPNWIQAPWDLTAEVRATEFHQAMARRAA